MDNEEAILILKGKDPVKIGKAWQFELYPNLLFNKKRLPNYHESRKRLGFTDEPVTESSRNSVALYFEDYQKAHEKTYEDKELTPDLDEESDELTAEEMETFLDDQPNNGEPQEKANHEEAQEESDELTEEDLMMINGQNASNDTKGDSLEEKISEIDEEINELNEIDKQMEDDLLQNAIDDLQEEYNAENETEKPESDDQKKLNEELPM